MVELLQNVEAGVQESLKMWGDGAHRLTAAFKVDVSRITNVMRLLGSQRKLIRGIQQEYVEYRQFESNWISKLLAKVVSFITDDRNHRQYLGR